jgi:hypothetical protein
MVAVSSVLSPAAGVRKMLVPRWRLRPGTGAKVQRFPSMRVGAEQSRTVVFFYVPPRSGIGSCLDIPSACGQTCVVPFPGVTQRYENASCGFCMVIALCGGRTSPAS